MCGVTIALKLGVKFTPLNFHYFYASKPNTLDFLKNYTPINFSPFHSLTKHSLSFIEKEKYQDQELE